MLEGVAKTALGTLMSRAKDGDVFAQRTAQFLQTKGQLHGFEGFYFPPAVERSTIIDVCVRAILKKRGYRKILNLGCGFCGRYHRIAEEFELDEWCDVDSAGTIALRREYDPPNEVHTYLVHDLQTDLAILSNYDLIIAEGCLMYLPIATAKKIVAASPHIVFDVLGRYRTMPRGSDQKWLFDERAWELNIVTMLGFGYADRDDRILEVINT